MEFTNIAPSKVKQPNANDLEYVKDKYNQTEKFVEQKKGHKKTPAISLKNNFFIETIQGITHLNRNEVQRKIKYPQHDNTSNTNSNLNVKEKEKKESSENLNQISLNQMEKAVK
jgi:hypothetical protein